MPKKKKSDKDKQPKVPSAPTFDQGTLKQPPTDEQFNSLLTQLQSAYPQIYEDIMKKQLQYAPAMTEAQKQNQTALYNNMVSLSLQSAPQYAAAEQNLVSQYAPQFGQTYAALGQRVNQGLSAGYELGDELSREVEQSIRGAQTARGNYLGPAATAQEAMGKGSASIDLYNQRLGAAQNYLAGNNPINMMAQAGAATNMGQSYYPNPVIDQGVTGSLTGAAGSTAANVYGTQAQSASSFNNALLGIFGQESGNIYNTYDRSYEQYLEKLAVQHGLFDQPKVGGAGGSGAMQLAGAGIGAIGAIGGGLLAF